MLNRIEWDKSKVQADVFSLEGLIAWLEKQPADKTYCYIESGECLLAQYFTAAGFENVYMFTDGFWHGPEKIPGHVGQEEAHTRGRLTLLPPKFDRISHDANQTFGAALDRARKLASSPVQP